MYQTVFFDLGGVLFEDAISGSQLFSRQLNFSEAALRSAYTATDDLTYSIGTMTDKVRWSVFAQQLPDPQKFTWQQLLEWYKNTYRPIMQTQTLVRAICQLNRACGILSDQPPTIVRHLRNTYPDVFSAFSSSLTLISSEIGVSKRDPSGRIFQLAVERAGCPPHQILYVDDTVLHLKNAASFGIQGFHFNRAKPISELLTELVSVTSPATAQS